MIQSKEDLRPRALIVEDEAVIALDLIAIFEDLGYSPDVASSTERALHLLATRSYDVATIDINLHGVPSTPVAVDLCRRRIPFMVATGYEAPDLPDECKHVPVVSKPFIAEDIKVALEAAQAVVGELQDRT